MLQIQRRDGKWIDAVPIANTVVVMMADFMERWTSGNLLAAVQY